MILESKMILNEAMIENNSLKEIVNTVHCSPMFIKKGENHDIAGVCNS